MMKTKICGITHTADALFAAQHGAWAIGFNLCQQSPRYVSLQQAKNIAAQLPKSVLTVGIVVDHADVLVPQALACLDLVQIYQPNQCSSVDTSRVILALPVSSEHALPDKSMLQKYGYILLDAPARKGGVLGGTGRLANWDLARRLSKHHKLILAGGLNQTNVSEAIRQVCPYAVDVASGVEAQPGVKDCCAVRDFLMRSKHGE